MCENCNHRDDCINAVVNNEKSIWFTCPEAIKPTNRMKVFGCTTQLGYSGGIVLVAAHTIEEAFLIAASNEKIGYMFDWSDDDGYWTAPDGNIQHVTTDWYPLEKWREYPELTANVDHPQVILEESHEG